MPSLLAYRILDACSEITRRVQRYNDTQGHGPADRVVVAFGGWPGILAQLTKLRAKRRDDDRVNAYWGVLANMLFDPETYVLQVGVSRPIVGYLGGYLQDGVWLDALIMAPRLCDPERILTFDYKTAFKLSHCGHDAFERRPFCLNGNMRITPFTSLTLFVDNAVDCLMPREGEPPIDITAFVALCATQDHLNKSSEHLVQLQLGLSHQQWRRYTDTTLHQTSDKQWDEGQGEIKDIIEEIGGETGLVRGIVKAAENLEGREAMVKTAVSLALSLLRTREIQTSRSAKRRLGHHPGPGPEYHPEARLPPRLRGASNDEDTEMGGM